MLGLTDAPVRLDDSGLRSVLAADVTIRSIEWFEKPLWQGRAFQLLAGAKGAGRGTYLAGLASRVTRKGENVIFVDTRSHPGEGSV